VPNIIRWIVIGLVAVTPFALSPVVYDQNRLTKEITAQGFIILLATVWLIQVLLKPATRALPWKALPLRPFLILFSLWLAWGLLSILGSRHSFLGWGPFRNLLLYAGLFVILVQVASPSLLKTVLAIALGAAALNSMYCVAQYYGHDPLFHMDYFGTKISGRYGTTGSLDNPNVAGAYFAVAFIGGVGLWLAESERRKKAAVALGLALTLVGLFYTQTLTAIAGWAAGLGIWAVLLYGLDKSARKYLVGLLIAILAATSLVILVNRGFRERMSGLKTHWQAGQWDILLSRRYTMWTATVHMIQDRPITGHGLGSYSALFFDYRRADVQRGVNPEPLTELAAEAHNEYLQIGAEMGLIGLCLLAATMATYVGIQWRTLKTAAGPPAGPGTAPTQPNILVIGSLAVLATVLINALANFPFHLAGIASIIVVILALSVAADEGVRRAAGPARPAVPAANPVLRQAAALALAACALAAFVYLCRPYGASKRVLSAYMTLRRLQENGPQTGENLPRTLREVLASLDEARRRMPTNHDIYLLRGAAYRWQRRYDAALNEYTTSAHYRPTPEVYGALGRVHLELKQPEPARAAYQKLLEYDPSSEVARAGMAEAELMRRQPAAP